TAVLPEPAPATISSGAPSCVTASRCCGLSPSRRASDPGWEFASATGVFIVSPNYRTARTTDPDHTVDRAEWQGLQGEWQTGGHVFCPLQARIEFRLSLSIPDRRPDPIPVTTAPIRAILQSRCEETT